MVLLFPLSLRYGGSALSGIHDRVVGYERVSKLTLACYTDCIHRMTHVMEYIIIAIATVLQRRAEDSRYSYGYGRHEYLLVFTTNLSAAIVRICETNHS